MAESAKNQLCRTSTCAMVCEVRYVSSLVAAIPTKLFGVKDAIVFRVGGRTGAISAVVRTMPVLLPCGRGFLKHVRAVGAEDVIAETEVFVEEKSSLRNPLMTVFAAGIIRIWRSVFRGQFSFRGSGIGDLEIVW